MQNLPDENLVRLYPWIPWGEPWLVYQGGKSRYGCRMCVAQYGLKGQDFEALYETVGQWEYHMQQFHREVKINVKTREPPGRAQDHC